MMESWWYKALCTYCGRSTADESPQPMRAENGAVYCSERCYAWGERRATGGTIREPSELPRCVRVRGVWEGVRVPRSVAVFDVRDPRGEECTAAAVKAPWGETLWSSERAEYVLGLKRESGALVRDMHSVSGRDYRDSLSLESALRKERVEIARAWKRWRRAARHGRKRGEGGGSIVMRPALLSIGNYGYHLSADADCIEPYQFEKGAPQA